MALTGLHNSSHGVAGICGKATADARLHPLCAALGADRDDRLLPGVPLVHRGPDTWTPATASHILEAVRCAMRRNHRRERSIYTHRRHPAAEVPAYVEQGERPCAACIRGQVCKQSAGPVMAKGLEDTAFYVYKPPGLVSTRWAGSRSTSAARSTRSISRTGCGAAIVAPARYSRPPPTIPSRRGHPVRIDVLSEVPEELAQRRPSPSRAGPRDCAERWTGASPPTATSKMLVLQTLIGAWPMRPEELPALRARWYSNMIKAARKPRSTPAGSRRPALGGRAPGVREGLFALAAPAPALERAAAVRSSASRRPGCTTRSREVVLKIASPGVPTSIQARAVDLSLIDPDNRRPGFRAATQAPRRSCVLLARARGACPPAPTPAGKDGRNQAGS